MGDKLQINPWINIWVRPRETIRAILSYNKKYLLPLLYWIYGFPLALQSAQNMSLGDHNSLFSILVISAILAIVVGFIGINIGAWLFYKTGEWIGGKGSFHDVRAAVAWSSVPNVIAIVLWAVQMMAFGNKVFMQMYLNMPLVGGELVLIMTCSVLAIALIIWGLVILCKAIGEAHQFSAWKALLNIFLPFIVIFIALKLISWLVMLFAGAGH